MKKKLRQFVSSENARPAARQHTKPCDDCPFARTAIPCWLGTHTAEEFMRMAHGEVLYPCHTVVKRQCAGMAIFRANVCKIPKSPDALILKKDTKLVFGSNEEFIAHHPNRYKGIFEI